MTAVVDSPPVPPAPADPPTPQPDQVVDPRAAMLDALRHHADKLGDGDLACIVCRTRRLARGADPLQPVLRAVTHMEVAGGTLPGDVIADELMALDRAAGIAAREAELATKEAARKAKDEAFGPGTLYVAKPGAERLRAEFLADREAILAAARARPLLFENKPPTGCAYFVVVDASGCALVGECGETAMEVADRLREEDIESYLRAVEEEPGEWPTRPLIEVVDALRFHVVGVKGPPTAVGRVRGAWSTIGPDDEPIPRVLSDYQEGS